MTPRFRVSELSLYSRSNSDDAALSYYDLGGFKRSTHVPEPYRLATTIHSVRAQYTLDKALVTANYAYVNKDQFMSLDLTESLAAVFNGLVPYASAPQDAFARANLVEFRASSTQRQRVEWLAGLSFGHHDEDFHATAYAPGAASAIETLFAGYFGAGIGAKVAPGDVWADLDSPTNGNETAAFGEVTYRFSEHWSAMGGGRWFHDRITTVNDQQGFLTFLSTGETSSFFEQTSRRGRLHAPGGGDLQAQPQLPRLRPRVHRIPVRRRQPRPAQRAVSEPRVVRIGLPGQLRGGYQDGVAGPAHQP